MSTRITVYWLSLAVALMIGCGRKPILDEAAADLVGARQAVEEGDLSQAMELLDASIASRPNVWAYYERARLLAEAGDDDRAGDDIDAGLALDPEHAELLWLQKQLKKPKTARFKGRDGEPPAASK